MSNYLDIVTAFETLDIRKRGLSWVPEYEGIPELEPYLTVNIRETHGERWRPDALRDCLADHFPAYVGMQDSEAVVTFIREYLHAYPEVRNARIAIEHPATQELIDRRVQEGIEEEREDTGDGGGAPWDSGYRPPPGPSKPQCRGREPITDPRVLDRIHHVASAEKKAALYLCYYGALREGEAVALTWGDVHPGRIYVREGKTGDGSIPVHPELAKALNVLRTMRGQVQDGDRVIPRSRVTVYRWCVTLVGESPHSLRHTMAMQMIEAHGYQAAADLLRHKSVSTTIGHYAKYHVSNLAEKVAEI